MIGFSILIFLSAVIYAICIPIEIILLYTTGNFQIGNFITSFLQEDEEE